jgi:hypothetical protein
MTTKSRSILLGGTALGIAGGLIVSWWLAPDPPADGGVKLAPAVRAKIAAAQAARQQASAQVAAQGTQLAAAPAAAPAAALPGAGQPLDEHAQRERALRDPVELRRLIDRLDTETDPAAREQLKVVLGGVDRPEAVAAFKRLATSSDAAKRRDAYDMLRHAPESQEVRAILRQAIASEQSPEALVQALTALRPAAVDPAESQAIVGQLAGLTQHPSTAVRSQSVLQLGQWDRNGEGRDRYAQALSDPAPEVRQAAVFAIAQSGVRGDNLKAGLLAVLNSDAESKELRGSALQALERFPLSQQEFAQLAQARLKLVP